MDLGIKNKKAIVCASSKGLGRACARSLMMEGVSVVINARGEESLKETFEELSLIDENKVSMTVADLNTEEGRKKLIESCPDADILINNNSGPPPINFLESNKEEWLKALDSNMLSAVFMIKDLLPGMIDRKFGRIVNITSAMVKSPHPLMSLSTSARTGYRYNMFQGPQQQLISMVRQRNASKMSEHDVRAPTFLQLFGA